MSIFKKKKKVETVEEEDDDDYEKELNRTYLSAWEMEQERYRKNPSDYDLAMMSRGGDDD